MTSIKFRGKKIENGNWVIGSLIIDTTGKRYSIIDYANTYTDTYSWHDVDPETVGQHLGFKDNEGKEVYKGDYISEGGSGPYEVVWQEHSLGWIMQSVRDGRTYRDMTLRYQHLYKVIGNIYDNPELNPAKGAVINTMITDPKEQPEEVKAPATETEQEQVPGTPAVIAPDTEETEG